MKGYLTSFFIFILSLAVIIFFYVAYITENESSLTWLVYFYFCLITLAFHYGVEKTSRSRPQVFIRYFMAATTMKLLLHLGVIVIYSLFHRDAAVRFIFTFMIMYLLFTTFEVMAVWRRVRT
jgi:hypothetical protein